MKICKRFWLKYQVKKYEKFLMTEGVREAYRRGKNIRLGLEETAEVSDNRLDNIYLPKDEDGMIDVRQLLALGAENYKDEARRYLIYRKMLSRMDK